MSTHQQTIDGLSAVEHPLYKLADESTNSLTGEYVAPEPCEDVNEADIIASSVKGAPGAHTIMLDLDVPAKLVPSTTDGHSHLYIDVVLEDTDYARLLRALREAGVIQRGFEKQLKSRGFTALRLPWVRKPKPEKAAF
jgi:hypothetical protein